MTAAAYRNLLFDFGNVIIDIDVPGAIDKLTSFMRKDANREEIDRIQLAYECGRVSDDVFINAFIKQSKPNIQALDIIEAWNSMLIGIPPYRLEMLLQLREKYNVYLLSNTNSLHIQWIHRYMERIYADRNWEKRYFDQVYYSHDIGARKPEETIFMHVIDDALLTPGRTLFIDDMEANIETAARMGFGTKQLGQGEEVAEFLKVEGFY